MCIRSTCILSPSLCVAVRLCMACAIPMDLDAPLAYDHATSFCNPVDKHPPQCGSTASRMLPQQHSCACVQHLILTTFSVMHDLCDSVWVWHHKWSFATMC